LNSFPILFVLVELIFGYEIIKKINSSYPHQLIINVFNRL
jgi:hypothetical protein